MKHYFFTLLMALGLLLPSVAQITPITVTPIPVPGFPRSPKELTSNGTRLYAIFERYDRVLHYSDNNGLFWTTVNLNLPGVLVDVEVAGGAIYLLAQEESAGGLEKLVIYKSTNGVLFPKEYEVDITTTFYSNGNSEGYVSDSRLLFAGDAIFMVYDYMQKDMAGNVVAQLARGYYKTISSGSWQSMNSNIWLNGIIKDITFYNNQYVLARAPITTGGNPSGLVRSSANPSFLTASDLPFDYTNGYPKNILDMGIADGQLFVIGDNGEVYSRSNTSNATKFTQQNLPFQIHSAGIINNNLYYITNTGIERAPAADPLNTQQVFQGPFNKSMKGWDELPFVVANNQYYCLAGLPLRSADDGLTWSGMPLGNILSWSGPIVSAGNQLFSDLGWGVRSADGFNYSIWHPEGLDSDQAYNWSSLREHKGQLFFTDNPSGINGPYVQKIYRGDTQGQQWQQVNEQDSILGSYFEVSKERIFFYFRNQVTGNRTIQYSDDAGDTWKSTTGTVPANLWRFTASGDSIYGVNDQGVIYSHDLGQTWSETPIPNASGFWKIYAHGGKITLINEYSGVIMVSPDAAQNFYQSISFSGYNSVPYRSFQINDSILLVKNEYISTTFLCKIGGTNWISFDQSNAWKFMESYAVFGGFLYGSQAVHQYYRDNTSTLSRIPLDQILDPLNNMPENSGWVSGKLFIDLNANCIADANEKKLNAQIVTITPGNHVVSTNTDGSFGIALPPGNYQLAVDTPKYHTPTCFGPSFDVAVTTAQNTTKTIAFAPSANVQDLTVSMVGTRLRPGMPVQFFIDVQNNGTQTSPTGVQLRFTYQDGPLSFASASPAAAFTNPGEIIFTLPAIAPYAVSKFRVFLDLVPDPALSGVVFYFNAEAVNTFSDAFPADNKISVPVTVTNSFDPNDKTSFSSSPRGNQITHDLPEMKYLIRFQNTGTDTAFQVIVRDTLSDLLDITSLKMVSASHPHRFVLRGGNIAEWHFNPIALPDSTTSEKNSHGFVLFSIAAKADLPMGTRILNNAGIYFDFNPAVVTNTTQVKVVRRLTFREETTPAVAVAVTAKVFPNPTADRAIMEITGMDAGNFVFEMYDVSGKMVQQQSFTGNYLDINRQLLAAGAYTWRVREADMVIGNGVLVLE